MILTDNMAPEMPKEGHFHNKIWLLLSKNMLITQKETRHANFGTAQCTTIPNYLPYFSQILETIHVYDKNFHPVLLHKTLSLGY